MTPERYSEGTGISRPLSEDVNLLGGVLGEVIARLAGAPVLELVEELRRLSGVRG
jgi:phosphoenolpyruvate carboxylase